MKLPHINKTEKLYNISSCYFKLLKKHILIMHYTNKKIILKLTFSYSILFSVLKSKERLPYNIFGHNETDVRVPTVWMLRCLKFKRCLIISYIQEREHFTCFKDDLKGCLILKGLCQENLGIFGCYW